MSATSRGIVHLVGAGPGDPDLLTIRGLKRIQQADVIVHDRLVCRELVAMAPDRARRIDVGKTPGCHRWPQSRINRLLVAEARRNRRVVRLKGGDPFVFGRGGEECRELAAAGIPFEVVPGVSSAVAAPALAGIPVTDRGAASAFTVVTGHACDENAGRLDWPALSQAGTLVVLMGLGRLDSIVETLLRNGREPDTPVAVVARASMPGQTVVRGRLEEIVALSAGVAGPATIVVGDVVRLAGRIGVEEQVADIAEDFVA